MTEKVLCPYCGCEMQPRSDVGHWWYYCQKCFASSPTSAMSELMAHKYALHRYQPENRVLTVDETARTLDAVWLEHKFGEKIESCIVSDPCASKPSCFSLNTRSWYGMRFRSGYGKGWRCWLRKPTEEERKAVTWG